MAWVANDETVEIQISNAVVAAPTYGTTLTGSANGFADLDYTLTRIFRDRPGFYDGVVQVDDTERFEAFDLTFNIDLNDTTKVLMGKESQYLYMRHKIKDGNTDKITAVISSRIRSAQITRDSDGIIVLAVTLRVFNVAWTVA